MSAHTNPSETEVSRRPAVAGLAMADGFLRGLALRYRQLPIPVLQPRATNRQTTAKLPWPAVRQLRLRSPVAEALLRLEARNQNLPGDHGSHVPADESCPGAFSESDPGAGSGETGSSDQTASRLNGDCGEPGQDAVTATGSTATAIGSAATATDSAATNSTATVDGSASVVQHLVKSLAAPDRRAYPRRESHCRVIVSRPRIDGPEDSARAAWQRDSGLRSGELLDISLSGAAFTLQEQPANGERIGLRLKKNHSHIMFDTWATVVRTARDEGGGCWQVYCQFERTLPFEQVVQFGYSLNRSSVV